MKIPVYLKIGKSPKGPRVEAKTKPDFKPFDSGHYNKKYYPTVLVKLNLDIPDKEFLAAKNELNLKIESTTPAIEIKQEDLK
jgi:hypothetical protein